MAKGKGKRSVVFEYNRSKFISKNIEEDTYKRLKEYGVKYSDKVDMYVNLNENKIYCVVNDDETIVLDI